MNINYWYYILEKIRMKKYLENYEAKRKRERIYRNVGNSNG
ncbi:hypothetical protein HNP72_001100 [Sphingobacterium soli]|nr:hypothetical protein [Sphingobacterium soli]